MNYGAIRISERNWKVSLWDTMRRPPTLIIFSKRNPIIEKRRNGKRRIHYWLYWLFQVGSMCILIIFPCGFPFTGSGRFKQIGKDSDDTDSTDEE
jgi:hypothetical protein